MNTNEHHWFALKVFYNRVFLLEESLREAGVSTYIPCEQVVVERGGIRKKIRRPVVGSLLFFRSTEAIAREIQRRYLDRVILYTRQTGTGKQPLRIPDNQMNRFMLVSSSGERGLDYLSPEQIPFRKGDRVRVVEGPFKGTEGYICRIKGHRRLLVSIEGICAVATSYIPQCFLERITTQAK